MPHVKISEEISFACLRVSTALASLLDRFDKPNQHRLWPLVREQLPPVLFELYASRLPERIPWEYQKSMIANGLASRLVYREGLAFVKNLPDGALPNFALAYLQQEQRVRALPPLNMHTQNTPTSTPTSALPCHLPSAPPPRHAHRCAPSPRRFVPRASTSDPRWSTCCCAVACERRPRRSPHARSRK